VHDTFLESPWSGMLKVKILESQNKNFFLVCKYSNLTECLDDIAFLIFSWKGVFSDVDSGIDYYMWSIGSEPGYTDMMPYMKVVDEECGITDKNNPLDLQDGHYYYINVRVRFDLKL